MGINYLGQMANVVNTANSTPTNGINTNGGMKDENKQERMELLTYVKAHFDLIAVTLLIAYLGYSIYRLNKAKG
jgi:hypothetical protein